jgi:hypothetical protein
MSDSTTPQDGNAMSPASAGSPSIWAELDTQLMVMAAHSYCLGRQTYMPHACMEWLWKHRGLLERNTMFNIVRDTSKALRDGRAGSETADVPAWRSFAAKMFRELRAEDKRLVREQVQPWPLDD